MPRVFTNYLLDYLWDGPGSLLLLISSYILLLISAKSCTSRANRAHHAQIETKTRAQDNMDRDLREGREDRGLAEADLLPSAAAAFRKILVSPPPPSREAAAELVNRDADRDHLLLPRLGIAEDRHRDRHRRLRRRPRAEQPPRALARRPA